jgi:hypothetical protein
MRRCLLIVLILVVAGAILNVGVAWGCALVPVSLWFTPSSDTRDYVEWPRAVPDRWPKRAHFVGRRVFGRDVDEFSAIAAVENDEELWRAEQYSLIIGGNGWPCRALEWELWHVRNSLRPNEIPRQTWWLSGIFLPTGDAYPSTLHVTRLPLRPSWHGFAINTIFYAALLWLACWAPSTLRGKVRAKRGLCPACSYPVGGSLICTECGESLPKRPVV